MGTRYVESSDGKGGHPDGFLASKEKWGDAYSAQTDPYEGLPEEAAKRLAQAAEHAARGKVAAQVAQEERDKAKVLMLKSRQIDRLSTRRIAMALGLSQERVSTITGELAYERDHGRKLTAAEKASGKFRRYGTPTKEKNSEASSST